MALSCTGQAKLMIFLPWPPRVLRLKFRPRFPLQLAIYRRRGLFQLIVLKVSIHAWLARREKQHDRKEWQRKTVQPLTGRKQRQRDRERRRGRGKEYTLSGYPLSGIFLLIAHSAMNSSMHQPIDECKVFIIQSLSKSSMSEHMSFL